MTGGVRGGSKGFVWSLTTSGSRLLELDNGEADKPHRKCRAYEPSPYFVEHTLALSELDLQLRDIGGITVTDIQLEPACWRGCNGTTLKPDMFAVTSDGEYDDHWFFELDLATETPARIVGKCLQYQAYYRGNTEQRRYGVFPLVVWIVPNERRQASLREHIRQCAELQHKNLFTVILPDELEALVRKGAGV